MKKEFRVKRNEDFSKIIARKKSFANSCFIIYKDENQIGHGRVGISVSNKLGNAVMMAPPTNFLNLWKRRKCVASQLLM